MAPILPMALCIDPVLREDTISFILNNQITNAAGQNTLRIDIDPFGEIDELSKTNNSASIDLFLSNGSTLNLLPTMYSIETTSNVNFFFQSTNILTNTRGYDFQIDTVDTFNSPYLSTQSIQSKVVGQIPFDLLSKGNITSGKVFYWRTRYSDPLPSENEDWVTSSFTYVPAGMEGWTQQSTSQLKELNRIGLTLDNNGIWDFITSSLDLSVQTYGSNHPTQTFSIPKSSWTIKTTLYPVRHKPTLIVETIRLIFWPFNANLPFSFSPITFNTSASLNPLICGLLPQYIFNFIASDFSGTVTPMRLIQMPLGMVTRYWYIL
ncbi:hypothetical protein [Reichenbachiella ulvae]|uniref:Uncharacterized protein n=1 Tax=Reichenbachiella ulvae TaxID=2980104 RepID=A0ABT3D120_9BACT|nr:hypothetical protein [Reichenbachiella ulvae]MCV9389529.1 hypothetical protein [Reichenbachiella ulvae]